MKMTPRIVFFVVGFALALAAGPASAATGLPCATDADCPSQTPYCVGGLCETEPVQCFDPWACVDTAIGSFDVCITMGKPVASCAEIAEADLDECLATCDPPLVCEDVCFAHVDLSEYTCGFASDPYACQEAVLQDFSVCMAECPPPPPTCEDQCLIDAEQYFQDCVAAGTDGTICMVHAERVYHECFLGCESSPPPTCEDGCVAESFVSFDECVAAGGVPADCQAERAEFLGACFESCAPPPPPPQDCEDACFTEATNRVLACVEGGGVPEECNSAGYYFLAECFAACPPPTTCEDQCVRGLNVAMFTCLAENGMESYLFCVQQASAPAAQCLTACPPPPTCEEGCFREANIAFFDCVAASGDLDACEQQITPALEACVADCAAPPDCVGDCLDGAVPGAIACLDSGAAVEVCFAQFQDDVTACLVDCGPPPEGCIESCFADVAAVFLPCVEETGDPLSCAIQLLPQLDQCLRAESDADADGIPDCADVCPYDPSNDEDLDGVCGGADLCPDTVLPEAVPTDRLGTNRFADVNGDGVFETTPPNGRGPERAYTLDDTGGCSCEQIIEALGLGEGHEKFGCSISAMDEWMTTVP